MWNKIIDFLRAPVFPGDEEKTRRAYVLNTLQINMGGAVVILGTLGMVFVFKEKVVTSLILVTAFIGILSGMILSRRGHVKTNGVLMLVLLWIVTVFMAGLSGGIRSLDIIFFVSGTVIAGIILGAQGEVLYAVISLLTGAGFIVASRMGVVFPQLFTIPPSSAWLILFINLVFTVVPLQVTLQSLADSAARARASEERYRMITSVMSDYAFSIQYGPTGEIIDQWLSGAFESITGYTSEEYFVMGGWLSILHPDDREQDARDMSQLRANQKVVTEVRIIRKDMRVLWVRAYGNPLWDDRHNRLAGIYGAVQDITERKQIDINLRQRADEIALLYQMTLALTSGDDLYHALRALVQELRHVMSVDAFHIGLYDDQTDIFSYSLFLNLDKDLQIPPRKLSESPGLTWEVISKRQVLYLQDIMDPATQLNHNIIIVVNAGMRSYIGIPLLLQDRVIGIMSVQSCQPAAYAANQIRLLETLAGQVANTVERLKLLEQLQKELKERKLLIAELERKNAESETLRETTAIVSSTLDISEAIHRILEQLKRMVYYDSASVWLYKDDFALMVGHDGLSPAALLPGMYELDNAQPDYPLRAHQAPYVLLNDIQEIYPKFQDPSLNYIHGWMAIPLWARGTLTGFISLDGSTIGQFNEHDAQMALTYANQVSIALENARLISDLQIELDERKKLVAALKLRNEESETLRESAAIVAATLDQSEAVDRILEQLERVVHYDSASVQLLNEQMLEIISSRGLDFNRDDVGAQFPLNENEPSYPVFQGQAPYILYEDVQVSLPAFNEIPHNNIHAWMAIPLMVKGQIIGIIALDGQQVGQFTERDAMLAITYANQVAVAMENARLFSELQAKFTEHQKLFEELENKNAELERFTYTVSHDLRSPLVTIKGFLGYLERSASAGNMESFRKDLARISSATDRMDNLLKDVLELSRIGRLVNTPIDVPFGDLVKEAVEIVHGRLDARGITLQILSPLGTQPDLPLVHVDKPRLIEVLQNLIDNAAKYMGDQPKPRIEIGSMGFDPLGNQVFFVRDNGMGIAPEYQERIFGLFDKLDASSEGTGIGLALVKRIIEFHGGRIWVESVVGQGTTFYFTLQGMSRV